MKFLLICLGIILSLKSYSQTPKKSEMVSLNGSNIYYEVHGKGKPLFLLHGYTQSSKHWAPYITDYANEYEVYLIDLKGHGKSSPFTEKLSIKAAAKDLDALIDHLKLDSIYGIGYSYGGDILFQLELLRPGLVKSMVSIGACGDWDAKARPDWMDLLSYKNIENLKWMREQQLNEERIKNILDQFPNYKISISNEELKGIQSNILIVVGDGDNSIQLSEIDRVRKNLPHSYLWIVPDCPHGAHEGKHKPEFLKKTKEFFRNEWGK